MIRFDVNDEFLSNIAKIAEMRIVANGGELE